MIDGMKNVNEDENHMTQGKYENSQLLKGGARVRAAHECREKNSYCFALKEAKRETDRNVFTSVRSE